MSAMMRNPMPIIGLVLIGLILTLCAVMLPSAMYAADYEVDNGNISESTNTTQTISGAESTVFWGIAILVFLLVIGLVFWKFFVK